MKRHPLRNPCYLELPSRPILPRTPQTSLLPAYSIRKDRAMRTLTIIVLGVFAFSAGALAQTPRFVIDDEEYIAKVTDASTKLLKDGKLKSLASLGSQVRAGCLPLKPVPVSREKLAPTDLCDRLRQSTLAVGSYYKCTHCRAIGAAASVGGFERNDALVPRRQMILDDQGFAELASELRELGDRSRE